MTIRRIALPAIVLALAAVGAAPAPRIHPVASDCSAAEGVDTTTWRRHNARAYTLLLPRGYRLARTQGVDSDVRGWSGPGGRYVSSDFGFYSDRLEVDGGSANEPYAVCEEGAGGDAPTPRIVLLRRDGRYGAGLFWPHPDGRRFSDYPSGDENREALDVIATSPREEDIPELLAIVRSVRLIDPRPNE